MSTLRSKFELNFVTVLGLYCMVSLAIVPAAALAAEEPAVKVAAPTSEVSTAELGGVSNRMSNKLGLYLGVGEPAPTLLGINAGYNVFDFMRVSAGYGSLSIGDASITSIGFGARAYVPGWSFTPTVGMHFGHVSYSGLEGLEIGGFSESGSHIYSTLGFDWQAKSGFNVSAGVGHSFKADVGNSAYLNLGWFFNWLG